MAILDIERYYYFKLRNGNPYAIKVSIVPINTTINRSYVAMTEEQKAFYLEHPTATVMEVWNCEITPPYVPPTPDVAEYAQEKVKELEATCYSYVSVTTLEFAMAIDKVENITADSYYSLTEARQVVSDFRSQSKHAMTVLATYRPQIEAAQSVEAIDAVYEQAIDAL